MDSRSISWIAAALTARDRVIGYTLHVRVDILLKDEDVDDVLLALRLGRARYLPRDCGGRTGDVVPFEDLQQII